MFLSFKNKNIVKSTYHTIISFACLVFMLLYSSNLSAQETTLKPGDKIRVSAPGFLFQKKMSLVDLNTTFLIGKGDTIFQVPRSSISRLEVITEDKRNAGKGALIGSGAGFLITVATVAVATDGPHCSGSSLTEGECAYYWAAVGGATISGALVGALIGHFIRSDKWERVDPGRLRLEIVWPKGEAGIGLVYLL